MLVGVPLDITELSAARSLVNVSGGEEQLTRVVVIARHFLD